MKLVYLYLLTYFTFGNADTSTLFQTSINCSQATYCNSSSKYYQNCGDNVIEINNDHLRCLVGYNKYLDKIIVSFRGTQNIYNWFKNIQIRNLPLTGPPISCRGRCTLCPCAPSVTGFIRYLGLRIRSQGCLCRRLKDGGTIFISFNCGLHGLCLAAFASFSRRHLKQ